MIQPLSSAFDAWTRLVLAAVVLAVALPSPASAQGMEIVSHQLPSRLEAGTRRVVTVEIRNAGRLVWDPATGFMVSYHWLNRDGQVAVWDGARTQLPRPVAPGGVVKLEVLVEVPPVRATLGLQWDVVQEGVSWLSELEHEPPPPIFVKIQPAYAASVVAGRAPWWMAAGGMAERRLVLRNEGSATWPADGSFALSYHWLGGDGETVVWDGLRSALPKVVPPGGEVELRARLQAPAEGGRYSLEWDMVHEGVAWFSRSGDQTWPSGWVVVYRRPPADLVLWAMVSLAAALVATVVVGRGSPSMLVALVAVADILWCLAGLAVKQAVVLDRSGQAMGEWTQVLIGAGLALVLLPVLLIPRRVRVWVCLALAMFGTLVLFADLVYERFFGDLLSAAVLGAAGQAGQVRASAASLVTADDLWFWIDLLAGAVMMVAVARAPAGAGRWARRVAALGLAATLVAGVGAALAVSRSGAAAFDQVFRNLFVAREVGVFNFHAVDFGRALARGIRRPPLPDETRDALVGWFLKRTPQRAGEGPWFGAASGSNVVMVQAESLQDFVIGLEVQGEEITPFLNRWAEGSLRFTNVTDQTAQGRSSDSELATQVSLLPPPVGAAAFLYPNNRFTGLASVLADRGYDTVSAVAFEGSFWNRQSTHQGFGYRTSLFEDAFAPGQPVGWGLNDRDFFSQMVDRLAVGPQPFCAYLLTLSLHHPFAGFPDNLRELELGDLEGSPLGNYLHTMRFFDRAFATLIADLEGAGLAETTMIVLWGDHDAGLDWTPRLAALSGQSHDAAGWYLSQRVPLLVKLPGANQSGRRFDVPAGHQDVAPTLAALLGVDAGLLPWMGRNLLGRPGDAPVVGEYRCWRDGSRLFLQGDGTLKGGSCRALPDLGELPAAACAVGFEDARRQVEISELVLEYDLQQEIAQRLAVE